MKMNLTVIQICNIYTGNHQRNPWELYIDGWKNIFNYQGLTSRRGFWWFYLFYLY